MRLFRLIPLLAALSCTNSSKAQFPTENNLAWSYMGGMPANVPWFASAVFASTDVGNMQLRGPVSEVKTTIAGESGRESVAQSNFDAYGNRTALTMPDSSIDALITTRHEYAKQLESVVRTVSLTTVAEPALTSLRRQYTYDNSGKLIGAEGPGPDNLATLKFEYLDAKPHRATAELDGESSTLKFDTAGRLVERSEHGKDPDLTITWLSDREFEVHRVDENEKKLEGKGTFDANGSLLNWSWQAMAVEPRLVRFRNEITYDNHANWTKLVTYVEAEPDENIPSNVILTATREITYR